MELLRKLVDQEFHRKLRKYGFIESVYAHFRLIKAGEGDRVSRWSLFTKTCNLALQIRECTDYLC